MKDSLIIFLRNEDGANLVEYALLLGFIVAIVIGSLGAIGTAIRDFFGPLVTSLGGS